VATGFARAARRLGVKIMEGVEVQQLLHEQGRVTGVRTAQGTSTALVISTQNIWATDIEALDRHRLAGGPSATPCWRCSPGRPYTFTQMPVYKDLGSPGMLYCRSYGGTQMLVSEGGAGETLPGPTTSRAT
jgi:sarcosine oxidase subunit beta